MAQGQNKKEQSWEKCPYHSSESRAAANVHVSNYVLRLGKLRETESDRTQMQGVQQNPVQQKLHKLFLSSETTV